MITKSIHRSTASRRKRGLIMPRAQYIENKCLLTDIQQLLLVDYINNWAYKGLPPILAIIRNFASNICSKTLGKN
ncbi:hypothetical protein EJ08DRAFT_725232 [Tothia fuscella]|uniref:Uncharacterized protein n=1 Tax=Tothia fuscella TaxID=1048955 RepID=A0A9P4NIX4_9PEZI|nr:hypothetical protein EJ08DRAFT_725232 [Tothia fuscella]